MLSRRLPGLLQKAYLNANPALMAQQRMLFRGHRMFASAGGPLDALDKGPEVTVKSVTGIDADAPIFFKTQQHALQEVSVQKEEPRFLENIQLFVDKAASMTDVPEDMLKYIMACDHVLRF